MLRQRFLGVSLPENPGAAFAKVQHELSNPIMVAVYAIAMIAICWHFAYGVWLFAAKWGITPGATARRRFGWVCLAGGIVLAHHGPGQHLGLHRTPVPERARRCTHINFDNSACCTAELHAFNQELEAHS